ncbi:MAG: efflux RND transporter permease subunit, partial [Pseudomonadota bacterium]
LTWRDARLRRTERALTITAQADPAIGVLADDLFQRLKPKIEAIPLPAGFSLSWEGEFGSSEEAQGSLTKTLPLALLSMVLVVVLLFNGFRQPIVVWSVVPLAIVGVVIGLVLTGLPLEFMGILGLLSLSGLIIQNALVLVYTADQLMASGASTNEALIEASASRLRPVMMGSFTTVFGILPLYFDAFFQSMTIVIAFGLTFATLITLVVVPALYALLLGPRRQGAVDITATQHAC